MARIDRNKIIWADPSDRTIAERNKFAAMVDDFATFKWNGIYMFDEFGAFIINEKKGSLKLYNGPSFKNTYSQQQFQDGYSNLTGITFSNQQISFTIGVYWISIEDYRVLMNILHPYEVAMLSFSFEETYGYQCKLANIKDSIRHVVGKEGVVSNTNNSNLNYSQNPGGDTTGYRYYTELQLIFDVIGKQCAKEIEEWQDIQYTIDNNTITFNQVARVWPSDLDFPIQIDLNNLQRVAQADEYEIKATAHFKENSTLQATYSYDLFDIKFKNLSEDSCLSFRYDSEQGLVYWKLGNKEQILSLLSTSTDGKRIVNFLNSQRFYWPGRLNKKEVKPNNVAWINIEFNNLQFVTGIYDEDSTEDSTEDAIVGNATYACRRRTNVI